MPTLLQQTAADQPAEIGRRSAAEMLSVVRQAGPSTRRRERGRRLGPPYARDGTRVYRHGSKVRTITSPVGVVTLTVPRARLQAGASAATKWQSQILPTYPRRMRQVDGAIHHHELVLRPRCLRAPVQFPTAAAGSFVRPPSIPLVGDDRH